MPALTTDWTTRCGGLQNGEPANPRLSPGARGLSLVSVNVEVLERYLAPIWDKTVTLQNIHATGDFGTLVVIAKGYEQVHLCTTKWDGHLWSWEEYRLVVCFLAHTDGAGSHDAY
jgi:hypothetical protein